MAYQKRISSFQAKYSDRDFLTVSRLGTNISYAASNYAMGKLLDIGCGNKPYEALFKPFITSYFGIDREQSDGRKVDLISDATNIPIEDNYFDTVFSSQVIEHVADHGKMLGEVMRLLKPGGHVIITGPFVWEHHEQPYDYFRFTKYGFEYLFKKYGFIVKEIRPCGGKWAVLAQLSLNIYYSGFIGKKGVFQRLFKILYCHLGLTTLTNFIGHYMDRVWFDDLITLNFVVIAQKPFVIDEK
jgi:SAM-dependent methyltransferase